MSKSKVYEALLVISTISLVVYIHGMLRSGDASIVLIYVALFAGIAGIFIMPVAKLIALAWYKIAEVLQIVMSRIILSLIYIAILVPIATLYKLLNRDRLAMKKCPGSNWEKREHVYTPDDLENMW